MTSKQIVHEVLDGMDRHNILCTTYQMRNFYQQLGDGFFTVLDTMNYIQHHQIVRKIKTGMRVLDMCCGRGLLLPLLRYRSVVLDSYTGIDIMKSNATYRTKRVTDNKPVSAGYYPFPVHFVEGNVSKMSSLLPHDYFDFVVYTSSIEHMHPNDGLQSLHEAKTVASKDATLYLTCPNTPEDRDGYDTQYKAHVYEWKRSEIEQGLKESGWKLEDVYGLLMNVTDIEKQVRHNEELHNVFERMREHVPSEWLAPIWAVLFPSDAKEIAYIATRS